MKGFPPGLVLWLSLAAVSSSVLCASDFQDEVKVAERSFLFDRLCDAPGWPESAMLSGHQWVNLVDLAKRCQVTDKSTVALAFAEYEKWAVDKPDKQATVFLLLRVIFDPGDELVSAISAKSGYVSKDGDVQKIGWPLTWRNGIPMLVDGRVSRDGMPYRFVQEYMFFLKRFPYRDLSDTVTRINASLTTPLPPPPSK